MARQFEDLSNAVIIPAGMVKLSALLRIPPRPKGVVLFSQANGHNSLGSHTDHVASELYGVGFATLVFDLLVSFEGEDRQLIYDVSLLANRLIYAHKWIQSRYELSNLPVGYFGADTGAAAALEAAACMQREVKAVVGWAGRPDLSMRFLQLVKAPTCLIVGELDQDLSFLNQLAIEELDCEKSLVLIPQTGHYFEEPGSIDEAIRVAGHWLIRYLDQWIPGVGTTSPARPAAPGVTARH